MNAKKKDVPSKPAKKLGVKSLREEVARLNAELEAVTVIKEQQALTIQANTEACASHTQSMRNLIERNAVLEADLEVLRVAHKDKDATISTLTEDSESRDAVMRELGERNNALRGECTTLQTRIADLGAKLTTASEARTMAENDRYAIVCQRVALANIAATFIASMVLRHGLRTARAHFIEIAKAGKKFCFSAVLLEELNRVLEQGAQMALAIEREEAPSLFEMGVDRDKVEISEVEALGRRGVIISGISQEQLVELLGKLGKGATAGASVGS